MFKTKVCRKVENERGQQNKIKLNQRNLGQQSLTSHKTEFKQKINEKRQQMTFYTHKVNSKDRSYV